MVAIHAPLAEGDGQPHKDCKGEVSCDPRPPRGGRHRSRSPGCIQCRECCDPRPPRGGRPVQRATGVFNAVELRSTPPSRRATVTAVHGSYARKYLLRSTPPSRRATLNVRHNRACFRMWVAIHAPLAEGDTSATGLPAFRPCRTVAIHAPLAEGDKGRGSMFRCEHSRLRSTPPSRRATLGSMPEPWHYLWLLRSTPPSRRATHDPRDEPITDVLVSLRSTPPSRRATRLERRRLVVTVVAIHAPLAEGDTGTTISHHRDGAVGLRSTPPSRRATTK